jgi:hypothetical protein
MNTTTTPTAQEATMIRTADAADVLAAGREFPMRNALGPQNHAAAVRLFQARRAFWVAAAEGYQALVSAGCTDSEWDVQDALTQAALYAPKGG